MHRWSHIRRPLRGARNPVGRDGTSAPLPPMRCSHAFLVLALVRALAGSASVAPSALQAPAIRCSKYGAFFEQQFGVRAGRVSKKDVPRVGLFEARRRSTSRSRPRLRRAPRPEHGARAGQRVHPIAAARLRAARARHDGARARAGSRQPGRHELHVDACAGAAGPRHALGVAQWSTACAALATLVPALVLGHHDVELMSFVAGFGVAPS